MAVFNEPSKWQTSLVRSGDANTIPQSTPAGTGEASFDDGFPQITQVPIGAGGIAPDRKDFNGLFKILGDWIFFAQNGGVPSYDPDFDYVVGRRILYTDGNLYKCKQANTVIVGGQTIHVAPDSVDPVGTDYWEQVATLASVATKADIDFSNIDNTAKIAIAHNALPSDKSDIIVVSYSGQQFVAPADGYIYAWTSPNQAVGSYVIIKTVSAVYTDSRADGCYFESTYNYQLPLCLPVTKGETFEVIYSGTGMGLDPCKFYYAVGSESEQ